MTTTGEISAFTEALPQPAFLLSIDGGRILWLNDAAKNWLGRSANTVIGLGIAELLSHEPLYGQIRGMSDTRSSISERGIKIHMPSVSEQEIDYTLFHTGATLGMLVTLISSMTRPVENNELNAVSSLGRMLAHELKNPLSGIRGASQILGFENLSEDGQAMTNLIISEVDRLSRLISSIETMAVPDKDRFAKTNIHTVLRKAQAVFTSQPDFIMDVIEDYDPSLPPILANEDQLVQVFTNLMANARDACAQLKDNGQIIFRTSYKSGVWKRQSGDRSPRIPIVVEVIDNGKGFDETVKAKIFDPFVTTKQNGQGLGLSLVNRIMENHNGLIEAKSRPGKTVFTLRFPVLSSPE